jgi:hypothetical protein
MGGAVVSGGTTAVVVPVGVFVVVVAGDVVVVAGDVVVGDVVVGDGLVVGAGVVAGPPPLPAASSTRPKMIVAIRITTATPHSARTHGLRYQSEGSSAGLNSSVVLMSRPESFFE